MDRDETYTAEEMQAAKSLLGAASKARYISGSCCGSRPRRNLSCWHEFGGDCELMVHSGARRPIGCNITKNPALSKMMLGKMENGHYVRNGTVPFQPRIAPDRDQNRNGSMEMNRLASAGQRPACSSRRAPLNISNAKCNSTIQAQSSPITLTHPKLSTGATKQLLRGKKARCLPSDKDSRKVRDDDLLIVDEMGLKTWTAGTSFGN
jgi:hypothetical protein